MDSIVIASAVFTGASVALYKNRAVRETHQISNRLLKSDRVRLVGLQNSPVCIDVRNLTETSTSRKCIGASGDAPEKG